jgi:hypothetical protein
MLRDTEQPEAYLGSLRAIRNDLDLQVERSRKIIADSLELLTRLDDLMKKDPFLKPSAND